MYPSKSGLSSQKTEQVNPQELLNVISAAASQDPSQIQASSKRLKQMFEMTGTFSGLHELAAQKNLPIQIRQQSMIQFKNGALPSWRAKKWMTVEQKTAIRARCFSFLEEQDEIIAECNDVAFAKIARQDFPADWPNLVDDLMSIINMNLQLRYGASPGDPRTALVLQRSIKALNSVFKEISQTKMPAGFVATANVVQQLHMVLFDYYSKISASFVSYLNPTAIGQPGVWEDFRIGHLVYKCLVKISLWLWGRSEKNGKEEFFKHESWFRQMFISSIAQVRSLNDARTIAILALRSSSTPPSEMARKAVDQITRHIRLFGKFFRRIQQLAAKRFAELPMSNELVMYYWSKLVEAGNGPQELIADSKEAVFPVRFLVQAMVLFRENLNQWSPQKKNGTPNEIVLPKDLVENAVKLLVTRFMILNPNDLENWVADPEEWVNIEDRENEHWEYEIRGCGERVLMSLSSQCRDYVVPLLEATFKQSIGQPTIDLPGIIQKEALYCALGRCASRLVGVIPFEQWLEHNLVNEARNTNPNYPILKRRIAWLIGKWVGEGHSSPNNKNVWDVLVYLIQDKGLGTDRVVRLTAAQSLRECVDTLTFDANFFAPYLVVVVSELIKLLGEADTFEGKKRLASSLNVIMLQSRSNILPHIVTITAPIPKLWNDAGEDWPFKITLLGMVINLIKSTGEQSSPLCNIVVPLVRESLSQKESVSVYANALSHLDDNGLTLWQVALQNTLTAQSVNGAPGLIELLPNALAFFSSNLDLLGTMTNIIESYILLDPAFVMQRAGQELFRSVQVALTCKECTDLNTQKIVAAIGFLVQTLPSSHWGEALHVSGVFAHVVKVLIAENSLDILLKEIVFFLARIVLADRQMFMQLMAASAAVVGMPETQLYEGILDMWWKQFDSMSEPRHRKLAAMGVASMVATGRSEPMGRLSTEIFNLWLDVFGEMKEEQTSSDDGFVGNDNDRALKRMWERSEPPATFWKGTEGTAEYGRRLAIHNNDPVQTTKLTTFVGAALREAEALCGAQTFRTLYLDQTDSAVLKQIQNELAA